ncbi:glycosyltransferase family 4 protein [Acidiphilium sp. AL]|uniref:Glycosyltransferase family 4 protein n=1 Tax=Acidiphilium iwatense TaxID=768198 RepID=A0ABS9DZG5_9PROT|nr:MULTISPECIES: glycosyltransferase [Acidiphilium]MCF3947478.1 glycosyltransferase family 4 protein [Acidiphilium iwatense]MCU4160715.1 glycosyltransferase family 4 protein [Acidiphilium sp. AL]
MSLKSSHSKRLSFVTDELPRPGAAGHLAYNHALIAHLAARGHAVTLYLTRPRLPCPILRKPDFAPGGTVAGPRLIQAGGWLIAAEPRAAAASMARMVLPGSTLHLLRSRARRKTRAADVVLGNLIDTADAAWIAAHIASALPDTKPPDAILIDTIFRAPLLDQPLLAGIPSVLVTHDVFHRRHAALSLAGYRIAPPALSREDEAALLRRAATIVAIQPDEARLLRELCPDRTVIAVPMPAPAAPRPAAVRRNPDRLVFVGSDALPNLDGLRWFFGAIWPGLRGARPAIRLDLVGDCAAALGRLPAGVRRLGRLADLAPALHNAALAIAPLRTGSGLKVKLLDYARHGLWTVATHAARTGLAEDVRPPVFVADSPSSFGATILAALAQQPDDSDAIAYIGRHYAADHVFASLTDLLET